MSDSLTKPKPFWTFSARDINIGTSGIKVVGWFLWCQITNMAEEGEEQHVGMRLHYLTPFDEPLTFELPRTLLQKPLDATTAHDVLEALVGIFGELAFQATPQAPTDLPMHKIPPSRRAKIREALAKRRGR